MSYEIKRARGRTAVFSGTKQCIDYIPRLEELCIQKLINNVNRIEHVGDVPYYILKPLLNRVSLDNLKRIEHFNPKLVEDEESDEPWYVHCTEHFEGRSREKGESWRDLFRRCEQERDRKLQKITKRIKKHEKKTANIRHTRVVDQTMPDGKAARPLNATTVITTTIKNRIPSSSSASSSSLSFNAGSRQPTSSFSDRIIVVRKEASCRGGGGSAPKKPKTAPLMQKSMKLFKDRFKRN